LKTFENKLRLFSGLVGGGFRGHLRQRGEFLKIYTTVSLKGKNNCYVVSSIKKIQQ